MITFNRPPTLSSPKVDQFTDKRPSSMKGRDGAVSGIKHRKRSRTVS
jgi:hypothetical protein